MQPCKEKLPETILFMSPEPTQGETFDARFFICKGEGVQEERNDEFMTLSSVWSLCVFYLRLWVVCLFVCFCTEMVVYSDKMERVWLEQRSWRRRGLSARDQYRSIDTEIDTNVKKILWDFNFVVLLFILNTWIFVLLRSHNIMLHKGHNKGRISSQ